MAIKSRASNNARKLYQKLQSLRQCWLQVERLEERAMMAIMHPMFMLHRPSAILDPAASASPNGVSPIAMRHAYGADAVTFNGVTGDGSGQTIAIVDAYDEPTMASDLAAFSAKFGLPTSTLIKLNQSGGTKLPAADTKGGWGVETALDVEWAHAMAPKATILLVEANSANDADLYAAVDTARNYAGVSAVSMSWGGDEASTDSQNDFHFTTPSGHNGVSFFSSSGDNGAYSDTGSSTKIVGYPAVSANVVAIGGTYLTTGTGGAYISETGWGSGSSSRSAGGSGGGISKYISQPSYQTGVVTQSTTKRTIPDVSFDADPNSGATIYDSYDNGSSTPWDSVGGTSLASPMWAGVAAVVNQGRVVNNLSTLDGPKELLPKLYKLPASDFHDITSGNNGYASAVGYDLVTGLGTPKVNLLVNDLIGSGTTTKTPTIGSFAVNPTSVVIGTSSTLTASNVTETGGTISKVSFYRESNGTAGLQIGSDILVGAGTQSGSTWSISTSTTGFAAGNYTYYAVATDAANINSSAASAVLTVTNPIGPGTPTIGNFAASPATVVIGASATLTASNVTETGGTISSVAFYRESNGTAGLQIGSDALVGTGTQSGSTWSIPTSTTGLAAGNYTYYAVATDASNVSSATASTVLAVTNPVTTSGLLLGWSVTGQSNFGTSGLKATQTSGASTNSLGLTRGSGVVTSGTAASNAWGGANWAATSAAGISGNEFVTFGFTVGAGQKASLSALDLNYRHSASGPTNGYWQYQVNGGSWNLIGDFANQFSSKSSSGASITEVNLSGISGLQNLSAGSVVNVRVVPYGATSSGGTWYVYDLAGNDLVVNGSATAVSAIKPAFTTNSSAIAAAIAKVPASAGQIAKTSVVNFGTTVYSGPLNVSNTLSRIRANGKPLDANDGIVFNNSSGQLPRKGTWYEFVVNPTTGTDHNFGKSIASPGPMRVLLNTDGTTYFTGDHYSTFNLVWQPGSAASPTIGSFAVNPTNVTLGGSTTLTASGVAETGGTINTVKFYRESNGSSGLQIGSDTLVGTGVQNGSTWSLSTSTRGLAAGSYTYYAVATDSTNVSSNASSAGLTVSSVSTAGTMLAWNVNGQTNFGTQGLAAGVVGSAVTNALGLTRGSGVTSSGTAPANAWGGANWATSSTAGISGNEFVSFGLKVAAGQSVSLSSLALNYRHSSSGPVNGYWQYQINGGSWNLIGDFANEFSSSNSTGAAITPINLSGIAALQNLAAGSSLNIRVIPYGASSTGGTWYLYDLSGNDLVLTGSSSPTAAAAIATFAPKVANTTSADVSTANAAAISTVAATPVSTFIIAEDDDTLDSISDDDDTTESIDRFWAEFANAE